MSTTNHNNNGATPLKPIPIEKLISLPDAITIPVERLRLACLRTLPRNMKLLTMVGFTRVFICREGKELKVKLVRIIRNDEPLAQQFSTKTVARAMETATGMSPTDEQKAAGLPVLTSASWSLPNEVSWEFSMSRSTTGAELLQATHASDTHIMEVTEQLLAGLLSTN